jgi:Fe-S-cluster containining protein
VTSNVVVKWLRDFYQRFEGEIQLLYREEPFWKSCSKCSSNQCCRTTSHPIMTAEWDLVREFVREQLSPANREKISKRIERPGPDCIFLIGNRCSVYPVRPFVCRQYPYTVSFYSSHISANVGGITLPSCPTFASSFGLKVGAVFFQSVRVLDRHGSSHLVRCKLKRHRPLWLIDGTEYCREYERETPKNETGTLEGMELHDWVRLARLRRDKYWY